MSETAQTLIEAALRSIGAYAQGETVATADLTEGLEALKFMLRHWSAKNLRIYYTYNENFSLTSATYYTIGSGGTFDTVRPVSIRGAYVRDSDGNDHNLELIDEKKYRELSLKSYVSTAEYLWYSQEYPLGKIYLWPVDGTTIYLDSLKPLTEPSTITTTVSFPPEYDEAIKYNLALRLALEYGREPPALLVAFANASLHDLEMRNFAQQVNAVRPEILEMAYRWNIDEG